MSEADEQIALINWTNLYVNAYPELALLYHIPNGGWRHKATGVMLKRLGAKAGVLDLHLPVPRCRWHSLYIEMKFGDNKTSPAQKQWIAALREQGHRVEVCYSAEAAEQILMEYLDCDEQESSG